MVSAYVFVRIVGAGTDLHKLHTALHAINGVKTVHLLAGPTDLIAFVETPDQASMMAAIEKIREVKGVASTDTRFVFPL